MQEKWIIFLTITKLLFINPSVQAELLYQNEWECINEILENHQIIEELLKLNEDDCQSSSFNIKQFIKDIPDDQDISFEYDDPTGFNIIEVPDIQGLNSEDTPISEFNQRLMGIKLDNRDFLNPSKDNKLNRQNLKILEDHSNENSSQEGYQRPQRQRTQDNMVIKDFGKDSESKQQKRIHEKITFVEPEINMPNSSEFESSKQQSDEKPEVRIEERVVHKNIYKSLDFDSSSEEKPEVRIEERVVHKNIEKSLDFDSSSEEEQVNNTLTNTQDKSKDINKNIIKNSKSSDEKPEVRIEERVVHKNIYKSLDFESSSEEKPEVRIEERVVHKNVYKSLDFESSSEEKINNKPNSKQDIPLINSNSNEVVHNESSQDLPNLVDREITKKISETISHQSQSSEEKPKVIIQDIIKHKNIYKSLSYDTSDQSQETISIQKSERQQTTSQEDIQNINSQSQSVNNPDQTQKRSSQKSSDKKIINQVSEHQSSIQSIQDDLVSLSQNSSQNSQQKSGQKVQKKIIETISFKEPSSIELPPSSSNQQSNEQPIIKQKTDSKSENPIQNNQSSDPQRKNIQSIESSQESSNQSVQSKHIIQNVKFKPISLSLDESSEQNLTEEQDLPIVNPNKSSSQHDNENKTLIKKKSTKSDHVQSNQESSQNSQLNNLESSGQKNVIETINITPPNKSIQSSQDQVIESNESEKQKNITDQSSNHSVQDSPVKIIRERIKFVPISKTLSEESEEISDNIQNSSENSLEKVINNIPQKLKSSTHSQDINIKKKSSIQPQSSIQSTSQDQIDQDISQNRTDQSLNESEKSEKIIQQKIIFKPISKSLDEDSSDEQPSEEKIKNITIKPQTQSSNTQSQQKSTQQKKKTSQQKSSIISDENQIIQQKSSRTQSNLNSDEKIVINKNKISKQTTEQSNEIIIRPNQELLESIEDSNRSNTKSKDSKQQKTKSKEKKNIVTIKSQQTQSNEKPSQTQSQELPEFIPNSNQSSIEQSRSQEKKNQITIQKKVSNSDELPNEEKVKTKSKDKKLIPTIKQSSENSSESLSQTKSQQAIQKLQSLSHQEIIISSSHSKSIDKNIKLIKSVQDNSSEIESHQTQNSSPINSREQPLHQSSQTKSEQKKTSQQRQTQSNQSSNQSSNIIKREIIKIKYPSSVSLLSDDENTISKSVQLSEQESEDLPQSNSSQKPNQTQSQDGPNQNIKINVKPLSRTISEDSEERPTQKSSQHPSQRSTDRSNKQTSIEKPDQNIKIHVKPLSKSLLDDSEQESSVPNSNNSIDIPQNNSNQNPSQTQSQDGPQKNIKINVRPLSRTLSDDSEDIINTPSKLSSEDKPIIQQRTQSQNTTESVPQSSHKSDQNIKINVRPLSKTLSSESEDKPIKKKSEDRPIKKKSEDQPIKKPSTKSKHTEQSEPQSSHKSNQNIKINVRPLNKTLSSESEDKPIKKKSEDRPIKKPSTKSNHTEQSQPQSSIDSNENIKITVTPKHKSLTSESEDRPIKTPSTKSKHTEQSQPQSSLKSSIEQKKIIINDKPIIKKPSSHSEITVESSITQQDIILSTESLDLSLDIPPQRIQPGLIPKIIKKEKKKSYDGPGYTYFAIQHRVQRLLESDDRDKSIIIEEILLLFNLLPECIKRLFEVCNIDMQKVKQRCDNFHFDYRQKCSIEKTDLNVVNLQCNENEDKLNDTCVQKCPSGFTDVGYYCLKGQVFNRFIAKKNVLDSHVDLQHTWGDQFEIKPCQSYGRYYRSIGSQFCGMICPEGWQDSGLMCEKPKRFINQPNFVFSQIDIKK